jgi:hypothetical protein
MVLETIDDCDPEIIAKAKPIFNSDDKSDMAALYGLLNRFDYPPPYTAETFHRELIRRAAEKVVVEDDNEDDKEDIVANVEAGEFDCLLADMKAGLPKDSAQSPTPQTWLVAEITRPTQPIRAIGQQSTSLSGVYPMTMTIEEIKANTRAPTTVEIPLDLVPAIDRMAGFVDRSPPPEDASSRAISKYPADIARIREWLDAIFKDHPWQNPPPVTDAERTAFYEAKRKVGETINPETAEVDFTYADTENVYGLPGDDCGQVGREFFVRNPPDGEWIHIYDLPEATRKGIEDRSPPMCSFVATPEGLVDPWPTSPLSVMANSKPGTNSEVDEFDRLLAAMKGETDNEGAKS